MLLFIFAVIIDTVLAGGSAPDLYSYIHGYNATSRAPVPLSPDPLVTYSWNSGIGSALQQYYLYPESVDAIAGAESFSNIESLKYPGRQHVTIMGLGALRLDFGRESAAWLEFDSVDMTPGDSVVLSISEYLAPAVVNGGPAHPNKTAVPARYTRPGSPVATYRLELNSQLYEGVRYGWITVTEFSGRPWHIVGLRLVCQTKAQAYLGSFHASDTVLEKSWWVGAYAVKLNLMEDYFGSILMDRGDRHSWTGDAHTAQAAAYHAFGNFDFILQNINRTACASCSNGIASYLLYWVLSMCDFYWQSGSTTAVHQFVSLITPKLDHAISVWGFNPSLNFYGGDERLGDYFEDPSCPESERAYGMLTIHACNAFAKVAASIGGNLTALGLHYSAQGQALLDRIRRNTSWWSSYGMHSAADAILTGALTEEEISHLLPQFDLSTNLVSFTPFNQYFIVKALFQAKQYGLAVTALKACWGVMLELGATSFWETFSPQWINAMAAGKDVDIPPNGQNGYTSLCHPWASGVVDLLTEFVLGVRPVAAGFAEWIVDLSTVLLSNQSELHWVQGNLPTGLHVRVNATSALYREVAAQSGRQSGVVSVSIWGAPRGSVGRALFPRQLASHPSWSLLELTVNGLVAWVESANVTSADPVSLGRLSCSDACEVVSTYGMPKGPRKTRALVAENAALLSNASYAATLLREDFTTMGRWVGRYGSLGYVLFSFGPNSTDVQKLPSFVKSLRAHRGASALTRCVWTAAEGGNASLLPPPGSSLVPHIGAIETSNPAACTQTFVVDIMLSDDLPHTISLYSADVGGMHRSQILQIFDLTSKKTIAPWKKLVGFDQGAYLVYRVFGSTRFRVSYIRADQGANALLSAVFFD